MRKQVLVTTGLAAFVVGLFAFRKDVSPMTDTLDPVTPPDGTDPRRALVVSMAMGEIGPQNPSKYWTDVLPGVTGFSGDWCGGFTLWALHQAGLAKDINWRIGYGYCYQLPRTNDPQPGDIAYFDKPYQHHAIVVSVDGDTLITVDGNQPGNTVRQRTRSIAATKPAFYSIAPLLTGNLSA